jgi:hypothetical protein
MTTLRNSSTIYFFVRDNFFLTACFANSSPEAAFRIALVCNTYESLKSFSKVKSGGKKHRCVQNRKTVSLIQLNFNIYYLNVNANLRDKSLLNKHK